MTQVGGASSLSRYTPDLLQRASKIALMLGKLITIEQTTFCAPEKKELLPISPLTGGGNLRGRGNLASKNDLRKGCHLERGYFLGDNLWGNL